MKSMWPPLVAVRVSHYLFYGLFLQGLGAWPPPPHSRSATSSTMLNHLCCGLNPFFSMSQYLACFHVTLLLSELISQKILFSTIYAEYNLVKSLSLNIWLPFAIVNFLGHFLNIDKNYAKCFVLFCIC